MWTEGKYKGYNFACKHYDEPSQYGIRGGRVSKLMIFKDKRVLYSYDRGEDVAPRSKGVEAVIDYVVTLYN